MEQRTLTEVNSSYVISTVIFDVIAFIFLIVAIATNYWAVIQNSSNDVFHMGLYRICLYSNQQYGYGNGYRYYNHNDNDCADLDDSELDSVKETLHFDAAETTKGLCATTAVLYPLGIVAILVCACLKDNIPAAKVTSWVSFSFSLGGALLNGIAVIYYTAKVIDTFTINNNNGVIKVKIVGSYSLVLAWLAMFIVLGAVACSRGVVRNRLQRAASTVAPVSGQQILVIPMAGQVSYNPGVQVFHSNLRGLSGYNPYPMGQTLGQPGYNPNQYKGRPADNPNPLYMGAPFKTQLPQ